MPRQVPPVPPDWKKPTPSNSHTYEIELITPMFGGGVATREPDETFPIRPTSIRGQLQFWWRATVGAQYATKERLREEQSKVWGDTTRSSPVQVRVEVLKVDPPIACARFDRDNKDNTRYRSMPTWNHLFNNTALPYALFPFQGRLSRNRTVIEEPPSSLVPNGAKFNLTIRCSHEIDFAEQVEPAIWAWVNFGGLGSRTRRGCGAIKGREVEVCGDGKVVRVLKELCPKDSDDLLARCLQHIPKPDSQLEWPTLADIILIDRDHAEAMSAWDRVIDTFRHFRQGDGNKHYENSDSRKRDPLGRNPGQTDPNNRRKKPKPGRSRYPEPEAIRTILYNPNAPWPHDRLEHIPNDAFPRAELGLPIVFHFQGQGEPPDTVLYPANDSEGKKRERMASPLILKPLALQSGKAVPLILRLKTSALARVDFRIKKKDIPSLRRDLADQVRRTMHPNDNEGSLPLPNPTRLVDPHLSGYPNSPLNLKQFAKPEDRDKVVETGSALDAFIAFARAEGFSEVPV